MEMQLVHTQFKTKMQKPYILHIKDLNEQNLHSVMTKAAKNPRAAHTYIAHKRKYPRPKERLGRVEAVTIVLLRIYRKLSDLIDTYGESLL